MGGVSFSADVTLIDYKDCECFVCLFYRFSIEFFDYGNTIYPGMSMRRLLQRRAGGQLA